MRTCARTSSRMSEFTCLAVRRHLGDPPRVAVRLCVSPYSAVWTAIVQHLYFRPRVSGSTRERCDDTAGTGVLPKVLCYKIKNAYFFVPSCFFVCYLCGKQPDS